MKMRYETLSSENVAHFRVFKIQQDRVRYPDGREGVYDIVKHAGAVTMVPIDDDGNIWFVRQYRHAVGETLLELPAGTLEADEHPEDCAHRELREEIGYAADNLRKLGEIFLAPGYSSEIMHLFLATQLERSPLAPDADEFLQAEAHRVSDVLTMLKNGGFRDAKTIAALSIARPFLSASN